MSETDNFIARYWFYKPFFDTKRGHIIGLATTKENMRDGLAISQIARLFPLPEYWGIVVEPGRKSILPEHNVILVGWASLFIEHDPGLVSGAERPASIGKEKVESIERLYRQCALKIEGGRDRVVINTLTGKSYAPRPRKAGSRRVEVDYGVIRRGLFGPFENTIVLEGLHRLGTIGVTVAASDLVVLKAMKDAIDKLPEYDDSMPLEVLVRAEFHNDDDEIYSLDRVTIKPLVMACNGQFVLDLQGRREWLDLRPWDVNVFISREAMMLDVPNGRSDAILPRLELRADLTTRDAPVRDLCRRLLVERKPAATGEKIEFVEALVAESDQFDIELWEKPKAGEPTAVRLPDQSTVVRLNRKRFMIHLILLRLMDAELSLQCTADSIHRNYPTFHPEYDDETRVSRFINNIACRTRNGFEPLLGPAKEPKNYLRHPCSRSSSSPRTYQLVLDRIEIVVKLRI